MVKLQKMNDSQHMVTVPHELRKAMGWEKGDKLEFSVESSEELKLKKK